MGMTDEASGKFAIHFGASDEPLFGLYHPPAPAHARRGLGVVVCPPLGDDLIRSHRPLRHLAERLAASGFAVLRLDYRGTGDSAGDERGPDRVHGWTEDVGFAADELRARAGVSRLAFVGLGAGGTLASAAAAARDDVEALVLWSAYDSGAAFVTEAVRTHRMHKRLEPEAFSGGPPAAGGEEALGFFLSDQTMAGMRALAPDAILRRPAPRVLALQAQAGPRSATLLGRLEALGAAVERRSVPSDRFLIVPPHQGSLPEEALGAVVTWCQSLPSHEPVPVRVTPTVAMAERPVVFGEEGPLFGILHPGAGERRMPGVVLLNAGCVHRMGPHRMNVTLARRLAVQGFPVLRLDLSGIGDSPVAPGAEENLTYPPEALRDVDQAMTFLRRTHGIDRFVMVGLCSGADLAFKAGFNFRDVAGAVMMNPRTFCAHDLSAVDEFHKGRWYQEALLRKEAWRKLLRGQVDLRRVARTVAPRLRAVARQLLTRRRSPEEATVPARLGSMIERGVDTFLLVSEHDPGVDFVDGRHRGGMHELRSLRGFRREDLRGTDHTFTALWAQARVIDLVVDHLAARHLAVAQEAA